MECVTISGTNLQASRVGLGTWAIGGWMWGGTDERESIRTIHAALDKGINVIDTAPAYGFGRSEEIVGKAVTECGFHGGGFAGGFHAGGGFHGGGGSHGGGGHR
jgi:aryl-alcohol dehydrogenase-like predicted oxidoreductase